MSFNPHKHGHVIWNYEHLMAANATTAEKRRIHVERINNYRINFPCEVCRIHLLQNLEDLPVEPYSTSNVGLFYHTWKLHDMVNAQLNKPMESRLTYEQAFAIYFPQVDTNDNHEAIAVAAPNAKPHCHSCAGSQKVVNTKVDYTEYRKQQKRVFNSKNA